MNTFSLSPGPGPGLGPSPSLDQGVNPTPNVQLSIPAALIRTDGTFLIMDATPAAAKLLGYADARDLTGMGLAAFFVHAADFAAFHAKLSFQPQSRHLASDLRSTQQSDALLIDRQGDRHPVRLVAQMQWTADGELVEMQTSLVDLSVQQAQLEQLYASDLQLRLLMENTQSIIFNIDTTTTRITTLNPAFETITGWARSEWIGKSFTPLVHPDDLALALTIVRAAVADKRAPIFELRLRARSGQYVTVEFSTAIHQRNGEVVNWLGIAHDITARKQAEAATKHYLQRLQTLHKIDRAVLLVQSLQEVAFVALSHLTNLVQCDYASIMILDFDADEAEIVTEYRDGQLLLGEGDRLHISDLAIPELFLQGDPSYVTRMSENADAHPDRDGAIHFALRSIRGQAMRSILNLPLLSRDVMVGVLTLASYHPDTFSGETQEVAAEVANQLAVSLQGVQLLEATQKARRMAETLGEASMALTQTLQVDLMLERLLDYLHRLAPYNAAAVFLLDGESLRLAKAQQPANPTLAGSALAQDLPLADYPGLARILESGRTVAFDDVTTLSGNDKAGDGKAGPGEDADVAAWSRWPHSPNMRSWLGVPLISQGQHLGLYLIEHGSVGFFLDQHIRAAEALAAQTAIALANARLLEERQQYATLLEDHVRDRTAALERSNDLIAALSQVATRVQGSLDPQKAIETLGQELQNRLGVSSTVALLDASSQALDIRYSTQDARTLDILNRIATQDGSGHRLTRSHWPLFTDLVDQKRTLFLPDALLRAYGEFFDMADLGFEPILAASGITQEIKSIFLPLLIEERVLGVLLLWGESLREVDIPAVTIFAGQIATALEMARLHAQVQSQRVAEQEALLRLSQALLGEVDVDATNQQALAIVDDIFAPDLAAIMFLDDDGDQVVLQAGLGWKEGQLGTQIDLAADSIIAHGLQTNRPVVVKDAATESRFTLPALVMAQGVVSGISTPMIAGHQRLGVLGIYWRTPRSVTGDESRLLALISNTTAQSIVRARLYEAEQQARRVAEILRSANMTLTQSLELDTVLDTLLATVRELIPFDSGNVMLLDKDKRISVVAATGYSPGYDQGNEEYVSFDSQTNKSLARAIGQRTGYFIPDTRQDATWEWTEIGQHVRSWLCMPLIARGDVVGVFSLDKAEPGFFTEEHLRMAETLGAQAASAIQNALLYSEVTEGQERLRVLTRRLVDVQETERSRVARSLHEGVGQHLTGLSLGLKAGTKAKPEGMYRQLVMAKSIVDELTAQVREMSLALRPTLLDDMGLYPALDWLFERHTKQTGQRIAFTHNELADRRFNPAVETAIFRIIQEILIDVVDAQLKDHDPLMTIPGQIESMLSVRVWHQDKRLHFAFQDQDPASGLTQALGDDNISNLYSLQERAILLGGKLVMQTEADQRSFVTAFFPLDRSGDH